MTGRNTAYNVNNLQSNFLTVDCHYQLRNDADFRIPLHATHSQQFIRYIDFSAVFDRVNHQGILYKPCFVSILGSVLSILTQFPSNRSHHVMVDGSE